MSGAPNPFEAPQTVEAQSITGNGQLDLGTALSDSWNAMMRNIGPWLAVSFVGGFVFFLGYISILGIFLLLPILVWGFVFFTLKTLDGEATLSDYFSGFSRYGQCLGSMLGFMFMSGLIAFIGAAPMYAGIFIGVVSGSGEPNFALLGIGYLFLFVWTGLVVVRFYFAPFFIVEQGLGAVEGMKASWNITSTQRVMTLAWYLVSSMLPMIGIFALLIGMLPGFWMLATMWAVGFRQLTGGARAPVKPASAFT